MKTPYLAALLVSVLVIGGLFGFEAWTTAQARTWAQEGVVLTKQQMFQISLAKIWRAVWPIYSVLIVGGCLGFATLFWMVRKGTSK